MIEENEFQRFLRVTPKYAKIVARSSAYTPSNISGLLGVAIGSLVGSLLSGYYDDRKNRDFQIPADDIENYIIEIIDSYEESIKKKSQEVNQLTDEISKKKIIDEMNFLLKQSKKGNKSEDKKNSIKEEGEINVGLCSVDT